MRRTCDHCGEARPLRAYELNAYTGYADVLLCQHCAKGLEHSMKEKKEDPK